MVRADAELSGFVVASDLKAQAALTYFCLLLASLETGLAKLVRAWAGGDEEPLLGTIAKEQRARVLEDRAVARLRRARWPPARTSAQRRRLAFDALRERGLGAQVHYLPVYLHPYYEDLGYPAGLCPIADDLYRRAISIPIFPAMTDAEVRRVVETVHEVAAGLG